MVFSFPDRDYDGLNLIAARLARASPAGRADVIKRGEKT
jgi:hypothetical protein